MSVTVTTGFAAAASSLTITIPATVTGELVAVAVYCGGDSTLQTISGVTVGGTACTKAKSVNNGAFVDTEIWYLANAASGETSVVITATGTSELAGIVYQEPSAVTSSPLDQVQGATAASSTSWSSTATPTLTQAGELVIGVVGGPFGGSGATLTGPSGAWTNTSTIQIGGSLKNIAMSGYEIVSSTAAQTYNGTASVAGNNGTVIATFKLAPPSITTSSLPGGTVGVPYSQALAATGGTTPYTWSVSSGSLPTSLSLSSGGVISGTPSVAGTFSFVVEVTDASSLTATASLSITISPAPVPFPAGPLGSEADLYLGSWTNATSYVYQRDAASITRGRPNESATVSPSQCTMTLNNRDNRFTIRNPLGAWYGLIGQNTPLRMSVPNALTGGGTYLRMEDDNLSNAITSDSSSLQITGTLDVRLDMQLSGYNGGQSLMGKANDSLPSWQLTLNGDGTVTLFWWTTGNAIQSATSTAPLPYLGRVMIRALLSTSGQTVTFYTAPTMAGSQTQLGAVIATGSTSLTGAAGTPLAVGASFSPNANGQFYEAQVWNGVGGSGGTLVADPVFTAQTAGATSFTDGQGNTWTMQGTAELSNRLYRYHGELASLPKAADPSQHDVYSQATASGILRRLQQGQNPTSSAMYRAYVRLSGVNLAAYWPGEDGTLATSIASGLSGNPAMYISGTPTLASSSDFVCSDTLPVMNGATFTGEVLSTGITWTANVVRFLWAPPAGQETNGALVARVATTGTIKRLDLQYGTANTGSLALSGYDVSGNQLFTSAYETFNVDGGLWRVSIELTTSGSGVQWGIVTVAPGADVGLAFSGTYGSASIGTVTSVQFGSAGIVQSVMGHFSVQGTDDSLFDLGAPLNAWSGETAGNRYARLCDEEGIRCRIVGFPGNSSAMGYQTLETIADLLQECETTDMGMQFEPRTCLGLGYITLPALYNQSVACTASYTSAQVTQGFASTSDDQLALNDITMTNADGSSARQVLSTGAMSVLSPPSGIGRVDTSITVNAATDNALLSLAGWLLWVRTVNDDRYPLIPFNLARGVVNGVVTPAAAPLLDIGGYLQLIDAPAWVPTGPVRQLAAGFTETLGPAAVWTIGVNGIPEAPYEVAVAGTAHADTDGSTLATGVSSSAVTLSIATTSAATPIWTTSAGDFPFDILMAGERMTVTNITGSSSPQTFTVTRSVNGIVKAQTATTAVALYQTPVAAL